MKNVFSLCLLTCFVFTIFSCSKEESINKVVEKIVINPTEITLVEGQSKQINAVLSPEDAFEKTITWSSSDSRIASVDSKGMLVSHKVGEVVVTASIGSLSVTCDVNVSKNIIDVESLSFINSTDDMLIGAVHVLKVEISPLNATNKSLIWSNSNPDVISCDEGVLIALKSGESIIGVKSDNNLSIFISIKVGDPNACVDDDGKEYKTVKIGNQLWMTENYAYLPKLSSLSALYMEPALYVYGYEGNNVVEAKNTDNYKKYGVLYNFRAARVLVPKGWRLPTEEDWKLLELNLGLPVENLLTMYWRGTDEYSSKFRAKDGWSVTGTNESGLSILPAGRMTQGKFSYIEKAALFWSSTLHSEDDVNVYLYGRMLQDNRTGVNRAKLNESYAISVRYIRELN